MYRCKVDGQPCAVAELVVASLGEPGTTGALDLMSAFEKFGDCLPCMRCREVGAAIDKLPTTRLGMHERNILLYAPGPHAKAGAILDPSLSTHSDRETYLRAIRKLARIGLLEAGRRRVRLSTGGVRLDGTAIARTYVHRTLKQTGLGALVVEHYREEMESGRAIRWERHIGAIRKRAVLVGLELVGECVRAVEVRLGRLGEGGDASSGSGPDGNPEYLVLRALRDVLRGVTGHA